MKGLNEYETRILIDLLEKMVVEKQQTLEIQQHAIENLKKEVARLEELLTPTAYCKGAQDQSA